MRFARVRSGLAESFDDVTAIAIDQAGTVLYASGDPDRPMYYRSALKPLQALAARRAGLRLPPEHLALTCSSHAGWPVHISTVRAILGAHGLGEADLQTTPDRPMSAQADALRIQRGDIAKRSILHCCSGKHAGWLASCVNAGWRTASYLDVDHPLQASIAGIIAEYTGIEPVPSGIDGCGAPTFRGSVRGLARAFVHLDTADELAPIAMAMTRFGSMVSDNVRQEGRVGAVWGGPAKGGAEGSFVMVRQGVAIATKCDSGSANSAIAGALHVADRLGMLSDAMRSVLEPQIHPQVHGGGSAVGRLELVEA